MKRFSILVLICLSIIMGSCSFIALNPSDAGLKTNRAGMVATWTTIPIKVWYDVDLDPVVLNQATKALSHINSLLDMELFTEPTQWPSWSLPEEAPYGSILLARGYGVKGSTLASAHTRFNTDNMNILSSTIYFYTGITDELILFVISLHELGHSLGLKHDHDIFSIMNGYLHSAPPDRKSFTEQDINTLKNIYNVKKEIQNEKI